MQTVIKMKNSVKMTSLYSIFQAEELMRKIEKEEVSHFFSHTYWNLSQVDTISAKTDVRLIDMSALW